MGKYHFTKGISWEIQALVDADKIVEEIHRVKQHLGMFPTARQLLEAARDPQTELHKVVCWNAEEAAKRYQCAQIAMAVRYLHDENEVPVFVSVITKTDDDEQKTGFVHSKIVYKPTNELTLKERGTEIEDIHSELTKWTNRLRALNTVWHLEEATTLLERATEIIQTRIQEQTENGEQPARKNYRIMATFAGTKNADPT